MTFAELIAAVHRDVAAIDPTGSVNVECTAWRFGHIDSVRREVIFSIWYDRKNEHYKGATPDEAYASFVKAVVHPVDPTIDEQLALCDTPTLAEPEKENYSETEWAKDACEVL